MSKRLAPCAFELPPNRRRGVCDEEALLRSHLERSIASIERARRAAAATGQHDALGMLDVALRSMTLVKDRVRDVPVTDESGARLVPLMAKLRTTYVS